MFVKLKIFRFDPSKDKEPYYQNFEVEADPMDRLLDCLNRIRWEQDSTLSFRWSCGHGVCGSDGVRINGICGLPCQKLVRDFKEEVLIEPLPVFKVIKDLIVDLAPFFERYHSVKPYLITKTSPPEQERRQSPGEQHLFEEAIRCILCACCTASCPISQNKETEAYVGPAALVRAFRYLFDSRDEASEERIALLDHKDGAWGCQTLWKCTEVCPKEIPVTKQIGRIKKHIYETKEKKMKDAFVTIHGHFYQPPRENPWTGAVETEESAHPFHDWNERITFECYRPNGRARIVDGKGKILDIHNNYSSISFNFGPTLLCWLEKKSPSVYQKIIEADREGLKRFGYGNAMAQVYNHIIMPLANERDKETEVLWGMADFERRFHRKPDGMWLPETAVNYPTLQVLVKHGMKYLILSPLQALRIRPFGGKKWTDVSQGRIDSTQPYRCFIKDASGKRLTDQFIDIFFYNGMISNEVSFGNLLKDGNVFCEQFVKAYQPGKKRIQLIHIATDGETYGHHKKFGDLGLAYALEEGFSSRGFEIINYGAFLKRFPPIYEVEMDEGPKGEGTSWSCAHGVGRWKEDCGCSTGGRAGWNQKWRGPLREALNFLRDELSLVFEREGKKVFQDAWEARNGYIEVILDQSPERIEGFLERHGLKDLDEGGRIKGLKLLEMERHGLQMFTSCGWFFADLAGLETLIVLQHAARAIELSEELTGQEMEGEFLKRLSKAKSNLPEMGNGEQVYRGLVKPRGVTLEKVVNHFAISSQFDDERKEKRIFSYRVERINYERMEKDHSLLVLGQVRVVSEIIPDPKEFFFGLLPSTKDVFRTWVSEYSPMLRFDTLREKGLESLGKNEAEMGRILTSILGNQTFTIRDTFKEERQAIFQRLIQNELSEHRRIYAELFDRNKGAVETLAREGLEIPFEIRVAAEVTLSDRLLHEVEALQKDFRATLKRGEIDRIVGEAKEHGFHLRVQEPLLILNEMLKEKMGLLQKAKGSDLTVQADRIGEIITLLDQVDKWGFKLSREEAQDLMDEILEEYVGGLEKSWWGNDSEKPFPPSLIILAEKLDFNVERFSKMINPAV